MGKWIDQETKSGRLTSSDVDADSLFLPDSLLLSEVELVIRKVHEDTELKALFSVLPRVGELIQVRDSKSGNVDKFVVRDIVYECSSDNSTAWVMNRVIVNVDNQLSKLD